MKKILIVEDDPDMREVLSTELQLMGFEPITAQNGKEGVEKAFSEKPHLIVLDILMPETDGRQAAQILRANPQTKDIPILAATVLFTDSDVQSCLQAGCSDYVVKPFTYTLLEEKVRALFGEKTCFIAKSNNTQVHV
jgi:CheY-like chemotaxis protein